MKSGDVAQENPVRRTGIAEALKPEGTGQCREYLNRQKIDQSLSNQFTGSLGHLKFKAFLLTLDIFHSCD